MTSEAGRTFWIMHWISSVSVYIQPWVTHLVVWTLEFLSV